MANKIGRVLTALAFAAAALSPMQAGAENFENAFDRTFGTQPRAPVIFQAAPSSQLEEYVARLAEGTQGRIGVAALDLKTGEQVSILGNQRFPMASTSKVAIVSTFLDGVDKGRWTLDDPLPKMVTLPSRKSSGMAPSKPGQVLPARMLIEQALIHSNNEATDGLLAAVGGPAAVTAWVQRTGIQGFSLNRDIGTLVRDEQEHDPSLYIDPRDSATPLAMVQLLRGLNEGRWLSPASRNFLIATMERCVTGKNRIKGQMPAGTTVAHKTGSLYNTSSDIGIVTMPDGHSVALAIYVTGGGNDRAYRTDRIALIARAIYDGFSGKPVGDTRVLLDANYGANHPSNRSVTTYAADDRR
ncbi:MAG: class A beta-lactamase [Candidatus Andeanibacterium colombiense]|uniref:beta-lactamase n=1 Tax=Candidatus Andeanibacterium colombiense TaxID=3121345 RepID=A0AAJ6BNT1_9SPHN|nr:MAG: class A beta-lactamase [Sphingomonadaceae bacterium]